MPTTPTNNVIAVRELTIEGDNSKKIKVEIFQPRIVSDGSYRCEFRIEGAPEGMTNVHVGGADSYQALYLTLKALATVVDVYNKKYCKSKLRWMGEEDLDFKF